MDLIKTIKKNFDKLTPSRLPVADGSLKKVEPKISIQKSKSNRFICPYCNHEAVLIWVHGHYQCQKCKTVIESCCESIVPG